MIDGIGVWRQFGLHLAANKILFERFMTSRECDFSFQDYRYELQVVLFRSIHCKDVHVHDQRR